MKFTLAGILKSTTYFLATVLVIALIATSALWWKLGTGIKIEHLDLGPAAVRNLFIQYDQGLIIRSDEIRILSGKPSQDRTSLDNILPYIKKWGYLIREINLRHVVFRDQSLAVNYQNGSFHFNADNYVVEASITHAKDTFNVDLARFEIIPYQVTLTGKASYTRGSDRLLFSGIFNTPWLKGSLNLSEQDRGVSAEISTDTFTDLAVVLEQFPIDKNITTWVAENISARQYKVNRLNLKFSLKETDTFGPDNISGSAVAESASVRFHDELEPVQCDKINITFKDDRLSFALDKPTYKDKKLDGSHVFIDNIIGENSRLVVNISTVTQYDAAITEILDKYTIYSIARQQTGQTKAHLELIFSLPEFDLSSKGTFSTEAGEWTLGGLPLQTTEAVVQLHNDLITIKKTDISYKDILQTKLTGEVHISSSRASLSADIDSVNLMAGDNALLNASKIKTPVEVHYGKEFTRITLKEFNTLFTLTNENKSVDISSLKAISPYVPFLKNLPFTQGEFHLSTRDMSNFNMNGIINIPNDYLSLNEKPIYQFIFEGTTTPGGTNLSLNNDSITASITDKISINMGDVLATVDTRKLSADDAPQLTIPLLIKGHSSRIRLKNEDLLTEDYTFTAHGSDLKFTADLEEGKIVFRQNQEKTTLIGRDLNAQIVENYMPSVDLVDGKLNVSVSGDKEGYNGYVEINNVLLKDFLIMNNLFAFINAIPALATFSSTGFDSDGYRVNNAVVLFDVEDKLLTIRQLRADGTTVNCEAQGWIDFDEKTLKIQMELITLKDYSKIIGNIPLAGYALLGEDGQLSTSLDISGNLDDPQVETHLTKDILMTPYKIIERTIKWPIKVFDDMTN